RIFLHMWPICLSQHLILLYLLRAHVALHSSIFVCQELHQLLAGSVELLGKLIHSNLRHANTSSMQHHYLSVSRCLMIPLAKPASRTARDARNSFPMAWPSVSLSA